MLVRFAIQHFSTPATCIARNACTGVLYCCMANRTSVSYGFRLSVLPLLDRPWLRLACGPLRASGGNAWVSVDHLIVQIEGEQ